MTDEHYTKLGAALYALLDDLDAGGEYPDAEHRAARKHGVNQRDLREAYDEFTAVGHYPEDYL
jgi:hypothetical protein